MLHTRSILVAVFFESFFGASDDGRTKVHPLCWAWVRKAFRKSSVISSWSQKMVHLAAWGKSHHGICIVTCENGGGCFLEFRLLKFLTETYWSSMQNSVSISAQYLIIQSFICRDGVWESHTTNSTARTSALWNHFLFDFYKIWIYYKVSAGASAGGSATFSWGLLSDETKHTPRGRPSPIDVPLFSPSRFPFRVFSALALWMRFWFRALLLADVVRVDVDIAPILHAQAVSTHPIPTPGQSEPSLSNLH